jgi:hypothetical protein
MFKVGDKVKLSKYYINNIYPRTSRKIFRFKDDIVNKVGVVIESQNSSNYYKVKWEEGDIIHSVDELDISCVKVIHTRLAEKLMPNGTKEDIYWIVK